MIITRLVASGEPPVVLELHPQLSVVAGLGPAGRARVADAFADLLAGRCEGVEATIVVDGAEFHAEPDLCELLELAAPRELVVLAVGDLPTAASGDADGLEARQRWLEALSAARSELAEQEEAAAAVAAEQATRRLELEAQRHVLMHRLTDRQRLQSLQERLATLTAQRDQLADRLATTDAPDDDESATLDVEAVELAERRAEIGQELPPAPDLVPVEAAVEAFLFIRSWEPEPLPEAIQLADRLVELRERKNVRPTSSVPAWLRNQTLEQLAEARAAVAAAEPADAAESIDPARAAALEEAHAAVDEAKDRANRRFATALVRRRLAAAVAAEQAILDELGFSSYSAYLLGRASGQSHDTEADRRLTAAKAALADAEAVWAEIEGQDDWSWPGTSDEESALRTQVRALVGPVPVEQAVDSEALERLLRDYRTPAPDWRPAAYAVIKALAEAGADVSEFEGPLTDADPAAIDRAARDWLADARTRAAAAQQVTAQIRRLTSAETAHSRRRRDHDEQRRADVAERNARVAELERLEREVAALEADIAALPTVEDDPVIEVVEQQLADLEAQLAELAPEAGESSQPADEPDDGDLQDRLTALDTQAATVAAEIEQLVDGPSGDRDDGPAADDVLAALAARLAARPSTSEAGSIPLLVEDALEGQPPLVVERALALLLEAAADRQIVYLTEAEAVVSWAAAAGDAGVALVRSGSGS